MGYQPPRRPAPAGRLSGPSTCGCGWPRARLTSAWPCAAGCSATAMPASRPRSCSTGSRCWRPCSASPHGGECSRPGPARNSRRARDPHFRGANAPHRLVPPGPCRPTAAGGRADPAGDGRLTLDEHTERVHRAYSARTLGELAGLTEDLVEPSAQPLRLDASRSVAALFTTQRREGRWVMPDRLVVTVVGGHVVLDLREALLQGLHTIVHATLIGGQLHLLVPEGVRVAVVNAR